MWRWTPRVLAILMGIFLALFAADATAGIDLVMHLAPVAIVVVVIAIAWRHEWIGAIAFTALALGYAVIARDHLSWVTVISGPLLAIAALYLVAGLKTAGTTGSAKG
jgi:hypothetical protein